MNRPSRRAPACLLAIGALLLSAAGTATASADAPPDPFIFVVQVPDPDTGVFTTPVVEGPFDLVVQVNGGAASDITLTPRMPNFDYDRFAPAKTIPGGTCLTSCQVTWRLDPASQATPWYEGLRRIEVAAGMDNRSLQTYGSAVYYWPVVRSTWASVAADVTANTPGYPAAVVDTGGTVTFAGTPGRDPGERVVVSVLPAADPTGASGGLGVEPLVTVTATGTWSDDPATGYATGTAHLDTSALPEGSYRLVAQAHDDAGHFSYTGPQTLIVRHSPMVRLQAGGTGQVATGRPIGMKIYLQNPRVNSNTPGAVRLTVEGSTTVLSGERYQWYLPADNSKPGERVIDVPTTGLPVGPTPVGVEVLDVTGQPIGSGTTTIDIVDFHDALSIPTLVVGKPAPFHLSATAPPGATFLECALTLTTLTAPTAAEQGYNLCPGGKATTLNGTTTFYPGQAGPATVREEILMNDSVVGPLRDFAVTVYANRTATVSAPSRAGYNTTQSAVVTVRDEKSRGVLSSAGSGVAVTVQRKKAGTTTWTTVGTGTTGTTGVATVRFTNSASGRLRALVKGAVPGATVTTAERSVTSVATVAWSYLPATARSGATVTGSVYAKPYEKGATVRFQARKYGATTWTTFGSGTVAASGYAKASARLYTRGTWEVRIQRVGTTTQTAGYSSTRHIKIS